MKKTLLTTSVLAIILSLTGCDSMSPTEKGAVYGGGAGALLGGVIGGNAKSAGIGALSGGALGAILGNLNGQTQANAPRREYNPPPAQAQYERERSLPVGRLVGYHLVKSPYTGIVVDTHGIPPGAILRDPQTGQRFSNPYPPNSYQQNSYQGSSYQRY